MGNCRSPSIQLKRATSYHLREQEYARKLSKILLNCHNIVKYLYLLETLSAARGESLPGFDAPMPCEEADGYEFLSPALEQDFCLPNSYFSISTDHAKGAVEMGSK